MKEKDTIVILFWVGYDYNSCKVGILRRMFSRHGSSYMSFGYLSFNLLYCFISHYIYMIKICQYFRNTRACRDEVIITSRSWVLLPILNHCLFVVVCLMQLTWVTGNHVQDLLTVPSCKIYINSKRHNWCFLSFYNMKIFWSMSHVGWQPAFIAHYKTLNWFSPFIIKTPFVTSKFRYA